MVRDRENVLRMLLQVLLLFCWVGVLTKVAAESTETIPLSAATVHWGYFSQTLEPVLTIESGTQVTVEMATHHACDDYDKMIRGDTGMMDIYNWTQTARAEDFRGATGAGDGVHILTGPIFVTGAEPGDMLQVEIVDLQPRVNPDGKTFGSNAAAWWGFQARVDKADGTPFRAGSFTDTPDENDEVITIYELVTDENGQGYAVPSYQFGWPVITDPMGERRDYIQYPGTCVPHDAHGDTMPSEDVAAMGWVKEGTIEYNDEVFPAKIPISYHVGCMGLAPGSHEFVDSIPPMVTGGNLDNPLLGVGTTMYYPVEVAGGMLSMGDAHAAQGNSELDGTGVETSITGDFKITLIKAADFSEAQKVQDFPLGETEDFHIIHGFTETNYLETYASNPSDIYGASSLDKTMMNVFTQTRKWVMAEYGLTENEATTIITQGVDFATTQVVDGNWGMHAIVPKSLFVEYGGGGTSASGAGSAVEADLPLSADNVHWGYFSKSLEPRLTIDSGDEVVVEMATHHACDDYDLMIKGDEGMEDIYAWNANATNEEFRGATGGGDGVHILTGPIYVNGAEPGDLLKVEILDLEPRANPDGKAYGSNAAAWWGYQARVNKVDGTAFTAGGFTETPGSNDEVVTIYELVNEDGLDYAVPAYQFEWPTLTDPNGVTRDYIAYPGTCVVHDPHGDFVPSSSVADMGWTKEGNITYYDDVFKAKIPVNYHIGCMGLAPSSHEFVDSIPPMVTGGNLDNKRIGVGTTMYYPVQVAGGLLSMGDAHSAQGDSELDGTGIETSLTGKFKVSVVKQSEFTPGQEVIDFPLGETEDTWIVHGFTKTDYLETFADNPGDIYSASNVDETMQNVFIQTRKWMMAEFGLTEAEAWTIITQGVDFGVTQLVDGNWGMHALIPKAMLETAAESNTWRIFGAGSLVACSVASLLVAQPFFS